MIKTFQPIGIINVLCVIMLLGMGGTGVWRYRPPVTPHDNTNQITEAEK